MKHIEIDLETLGTVPGSVILSIGAVVFDPDKPNTHCLGEEFYCVVGRANSELRGLTVDQSTVDWWKKQSPEARQVLTDTEDPERYDLLAEALIMLSEFITRGTTSKNVKVWSNGANFDQPLLAVAYHKCGIPLPWEYWNGMCHRTIKSICPSAKALEPPKVCAHNALEDAKWQAKHLVAMARSLKIRL